MTSSNDFQHRKFPMNECHVGYIVRGRPSFSTTLQHPLDDPIHTDCILPNGGIAGYSYTEELYHDGIRRHLHRQQKPKGLKGEIAINEQVASYYREVTAAIKYHVLSTVFVMEVNRVQARIFHEYWKELSHNPPKYNRIFNNCSTICYEAFRIAGLLGARFLPMTPVKLHNALLKKYQDIPRYRVIHETGFFGLERDARSPATHHIVIANLKKWEEDIVFFSKKDPIIRWDFNQQQQPTLKVMIKITSIQPFKNSLFGIRNDPGSFSYIPNAMKVLGVIQDENQESLEKKEVTLLIPEADLEEIKSGESIRIWLSDNNRCFKIEKVD